MGKGHGTGMKEAGTLLVIPRCIYHNDERKNINSIMHSFRSSHTAMTDRPW